MKKLFALISLLGLVLGLGGTLNAQEELDRVELQGRFAEQGAEQTLKFEFSATPGEKFIIRWHLGHFDTIDVKTSEELEATYTFSKEYTDQHASFSFDFLALSSTGHIRNFHIDSNNRYTSLIFLDCPLLDTAHISHNDLENLDFRNCPALTFVDCSYNKLIYSFFRQDSNWFPNLTYLDYSHNDIKSLIATDCITLKTLDISYNRRLYYLIISDCKALTSLTIQGNDSLKTLNVSNLPLQHLTCTECQNLSEINADNCRLQTLDVSGNPALKRLDCIGNQITSLILNDCPVLEWLLCSNNQLTSLTFNDCPALVFIDCDYNQLSYIDLSPCKNLQEFYCRNNRFSSLKIPDDMVLHQLACDSNHIPLSTLVDLIRHYHGGWDTNRQFLTLAPLQVGRLLNLSGETHLSDCLRCEQYTLFFNGKQIESRYSDGAEDFGYGLFTFDRAGDYRLCLRSYLYLDEIGHYFDMYAYYDLTVVDSVVRPQFSIPSGAVLPDTALSLSTPTPDARIYYTIDGSDPSENALLYQDPIRITEAVTIKAIVIQDTFKSRIAIATYTIDTDGARPAFSIPSGKVKRGTTVSLSTATPNIRIIYTTDGSEPDNNALEYAAPIRISEAMTIKAVAIYKNIQSQVATASYTIDSVANEHDLRASNLRVYTKDRTIYLSEAVGEVEVFTVRGTCVYHGYDTAIPVKQSGIYVVSAAGKRWKVAVR